MTADEQRKLADIAARVSGGQVLDSPEVVALKAEVAMLRKALYRLFYAIDSNDDSWKSLEYTNYIMAETRIILGVEANETNIPPE